MALGLSVYWLGITLVCFVFVFVFLGFLVFFLGGGWGGPIFFKISDLKQNDISKHCTKSQKCSCKITEVI